MPKVYSTLEEALASSIRWYRSEADLSYEALAELVGITKQQLFNIEQGRTQLDKVPAQRLTAALKIPSQLFQGQEYATYTELNDFIISDPFYSEHEPLEAVFSTATPHMPNEAKEEIAVDCIRKGLPIPNFESLSPTNMTASGILDHLVSAGLPYFCDLNSTMMFPKDAVKEFFINNFLALPAQWFPNSPHNSEYGLEQLFENRKTGDALAKKERTRQKEQDEQVERELRKLQLEKLKAEIEEGSESYIKNDSTKRKAGITQNDAATLCGVSLRTLQNWDKGIRRPDRYPGRGDAAAFSIFASEYQNKKRFSRAVRAVDRAASLTDAKIDLERTDTTGNPWE